MVERISAFFRRLLFAKAPSSPAARFVVNILPYNVFVWVLLVAYLLPVAFMINTAFLSTEQLGDRKAPWYPSRIVTCEYQGKARQVFEVPFAGGARRLAMVEKQRTFATFVDPQHLDAGLIRWEGDWRKLRAVYEPHLNWQNFMVLLRGLPVPTLLRNTLLLTLIGEIGVLASSILIAYGFARFPLPGGDLLFYLLIATILIPEKVTFIPTFFFYVNFLHWKGTYFPLLIHQFFGNAMYIFLLRQNFRSIPIDLEEAAMIDGAGPLRRLFSIILPQSWPVIVTVTLLHFFYSWNETRLVSLYVGTNKALLPLSFGMQNYQSRVPIQNIIQASTLIVMIIPVVVLLLSQRFFMRGLVITGMEK
jgi:multiple sugar transport system permease protein